MYCKPAFARSLFGIAAVVLLLSAGACSRQRAVAGAQRLAILRFENLGDPAEDWMGRAFSEVLSTDMAPPPGVLLVASSRLHAAALQLGPRAPQAPGVSSERGPAMVGGANRLGYGDYWVRGGALYARLTVEDLESRKMVQVISATGSANDLMGVAAGLARQLSGRLQTHGPNRQAALEGWATATELGSADGPRAIELLQGAVTADPDFAPAYQMLAEWKVRQGDRAGAETVLQQGLARGGQIDEASRARMQLLLAGLRGDAAERERALASLARIEPGDTATWKALGDAAFNRRDYAGAAAAYQKLVEHEPGNADAWNQLGYTSAYAGRLEDAEKALRRYQSLRPADPNPLDSLGDVNVIAGRVREGEGFYLEAARKTPGFLNHGDLYKAAIARLMTGDVPGADGLAENYFAARQSAHDPLVEYYRAEWSWTSGRRKDGMQKMTAFAQNASAGPLRAAAGRVYAELAIWTAAMGDRNAAGQFVQRALAAGAGQAGAILGVAALLSQPPGSAAELSARAGQIFRGEGAEGVREIATVYALLLQGDFRAAAEPLESIFKRTNPTSDEGAGVMLSWVWLKTGRDSDAASLLRFNPIPPNGPGTPTLFFQMPRIYQLRALAAEKQGKTEEAHANEQLFEKLSGPDALVWERAR